MCVLRALCFIAALTFFVVHVQSQSNGAPTTQKDPQAITILNQAVAALGGAVAIGAIRDYSGTGTLTFHQSTTQQLEGTVSISGLGLDEFRMDSNLSTGTRSFSIAQGRTNRKREDGTISHFPPTGPVPSSDAFPYVTPIFPSGIGFPNEELLAAINNGQLGVSYKGVAQLDGRPVYDIEVQRIVLTQPRPADPMAEYNVLDLFIDASTNQLLMARDHVPNHVVHQIQYSDYRLVSTILVPFSITEEMAGQKTWDVRLSQFRFNTGLVDTNFTF
jgi:hypothetical protein